MFNNIGGKIKVYAKVICGIGIGLSILSGLSMFLSAAQYNDAEESALFAIGGLIIIALGCLFSWIGSFFIYGFGELIDNTEEIKRNTCGLGNNKTLPKATVAHNPPTVYKCPTCGNNVVFGTPNCSNCNQPFNWGNASANPEKVHKWKCENCGSMTSKTPCEICGYVSNVGE